MKISSFGAMLQCPNLYIKDERQNPTGSFKDRQAAVTVAALLESGINEIVVVSSGNVALSYAAQAARNGIKLWAFLPSRVPALKIREISLYGAHVIKTSGNYDQTKQLAHEFARQRNIFLDQSAQTVPSVEAMKTIAFEITEQLTAHMGSPIATNLKTPLSPWRPPDWYIQPVSAGLGPVGVLKGFSELRLMGLIDHTPAMGLIQPEGCAPMVRAWLQGSDVAEPLFTQDTDIESLSIVDPGRAYTLLHHRMEQESGGTFESVTDRETYKAINMLARMEGISVEPAAGVAFAGLIKLCNRGVIKEKDVVVVNCTGHTTPLEKITRMTSLERKKRTSSLVLTNHEDMISVLNQIDFSETPRLLIAAANEKNNRILHLYATLLGATEVIEVSDPEQIVSTIITGSPDLVILDMVSSKINGFSVLDTLYENNSQNPIPIIGMLNAVLTNTEIVQLAMQLEVLIKRGELLSSDLTTELRTLMS